MKIFFTLLLFIPSLSWSFDIHSLEGTTLISEKKYQKLRDEIEFIVFKEVIDDNTAYIILEEKNRKNIKYSTNVNADYSNLDPAYVKIVMSGRMIYENFCDDYISSRYDYRAVMNKTTSFVFSNYPSDYQAKINCLTESEYISKQIETIRRYTTDLKWALEAKFCTETSYAFIIKHNCKVEGLYEELDYLNKVVNQSKSNIVVQECLDLGFKKGTEGLKNCVLELN